MLLLLLMAAFLGPWTYTMDGAPPAEWCTSPYLLLDNGRCGSLVSGASILFFVGANFAGLVAGLVNGEMALVDAVVQFMLSTGIFVLLLPLLVTLLRVRYAEGRRFRVFHRISWGLAIGPSVWIAAFAPGSSALEFWGMWFYITLAVGTLTLTIAGPSIRSRFRQADP